MKAKKKRKNSTWQFWLIIAIPLLFIIIFNYLPMFGIVIAFKDYSPNGAIFIGKTDEKQKKKHFFGERAIAFKMTAFDSVDVDTEVDYKFAKLCMEERIKGNC